MHKITHCAACRTARTAPLPQGGNKLRPDLEGPYASLREAARKVAKVAADCKMELDVEEYVESFRPGACV